ncbi:ImuA family protein [Sphingobium sp. CR28]|uniref:ImuA family protein n=1 Tax=Sphingobium sp. CR28 TaxID=3400272 RepID=UPI003FEDEB90
MSNVLALLRETIAAIEAERATTPCLSFGISKMDARLSDGGLRIDALHEAWAGEADPQDDAPASLFIAGIAARNPGPVLWLVRRHNLFTPALSQAGLAPERLIFAAARNDADLLAAMEDALRHRGLGAVIAEVGKASLTATRRLQLAAEGGTTMALLFRRSARGDVDPLAEPSAARTKWRISAAPSAPLPMAGVGRARWRVELLRQRGGDPFEMTVEACDETGCCALATELVDRPDSSRRTSSRVAA